MTARALLLLAAALGLHAPPANAQPAQPATRPIEVGQSFTLASRALGEPREINVYLPAGYASGERRYPVVYLIDGGLDQDFLHVAGTSQLGGIWGRSQEAIVVGVATRDRRRELVGPTADPELLRRYPTAGRSEDFRRFLRDEVKPAIEQRYRTNGTDGIIGESLAGLFIVETFLRAPDMFDSYAAISPSLWWDRERLSNEAARLLGPAHRSRRIYIAAANEGADMQVSVDRVRTALQGHTQLCYIARSDLTHATIYHSVSPQALQFLLPPAAAPDPQWGFDLPCSTTP